MRKLQYVNRFENYTHRKGRYTLVHFILGMIFTSDGIA
jgi:hypothetical protein